MTPAVEAPVSRALAAELKKKVRERGIVVWLDTERQYTPLARRLQSGDHAFGYPVVTFDDSYLELMLALEAYGNGLQREHVLVHLPGLNKDSIKDTPVYELYKAGTVFERNLAALVKDAAVGLARPDDVDTFLKAPGLTLEGGDAFLAGQRSEPADRLASLLDNLGADDVAVLLVTEDPRLRQHLPAGAPAMLDILGKGFGLDAAWRTFITGDAELRPDTMATLVASFVMAAEFVDDLREAPVTPALQPLAKLGPFAKACRRVAMRLRDQHPDVYEQLAGEMQDRLVAERTSHHACVLGAIDTFRFEEATTRAAAIGALRRGEWQKASDLATERTPAKCFWVRRSASLERTWEILSLAASTGRALDATSGALATCRTLEAVVDRYAQKLAEVDRAHRLFEQRAHALVASDLDDYDDLLEVRVAVRKAYRAWADATSRALFEACKKHGVLPDRSLRQRAIYADVVEPLVDKGGRVAFLMVDALRFEMAQALAADLEKERFVVSLKPRLAELPSVTEVGMNALAPVEESGRLRLVMRDGDIAGFASREITVSDPASRVRAMSLRSLGPSLRAEDILLEELQDIGLPSLKRRLQSKPSLVVVRSRELDSAGEHGLHLGTFEHTLAQLKSAILLLSNAGVDRFVLVSDHGFLLQDSGASKVAFGGRKRSADRRHALVDEPTGMPDVLEVKLSELEYDVAEDATLVFRSDTALWDTTTKIAPFVHGGNSLQERVIPVLVLERQGSRGKTTSKYEVVARAEPAHLGRQRLRVAVRLQNRENASLGFAAPKEVSLALRVPGRPDVVIQVRDAGPPATLADGRVLVPPNRDEVIVEFELEGDEDGKVRVEIYHPDAVEDVTAKVVEGFFDVARNRRLPKPTDATLARDANDEAPSWEELVEDEAFRKVITRIKDQRSVDELELQQVLGSPRRVRSFSRAFDELLPLLPFEIEIVVVNGLKAYVRKD